MRRSIKQLTWLGFALLATIAGSAARLDAAEPAESGRDTARYSADRRADFLHMHLEIWFTSDGITNRTCRGRVTHTLRARGQPINSVTLDAVDMKIQSVANPGEGQPLTFSYDDEILTIQLPRPVTQQDEISIAIDFEIHDPPKGMYFILPSKSSPQKPTMVYTMSEPLEARYWMPCHDWPNERWTSEIIVIVPTENTVVSNGELIEKKLTDDAQLATFHFKNDVPTDPHLMGFVFGELVPIESQWRNKPVRVYTQPGHEDAARHTFRRVDQMLEYFTTLTGVDYPYASYNHVTVVDHHHGGMEHAGYSLLRPMFLSTGDDGEMPLDWIEHNYIAHMLAHQWFAGIANYRSVSEAWLNEGFGTYLDHLWHGQAYGEDHFDQLMWQDARRMARFDSSESGVPMVNRHLEEAEDIYTADGGKIYVKGAWVLHMLRHQLGNDLFWQAVTEYLNQYRFKSVETANLRRVLEDAAGLDVEHFFRQWV